MAPSLDVTHIGTATAILEINGVNFLTDPFFSTAGTSWDRGRVILKVTEDLGLRLDQLPVIDAVLLSHEDHPDNLDELGRQLLDGRRVFTTCDGAKNLAPRPPVHGMKAWEEIDIPIAGKQFKIVAVPTKHVPGNECTGFIVTGEDFGHGREGLPNAIYFTGDTVYIDELDSIADRPRMQITMGGKDGAKLFRALKADVLFGDELRQAFEEEGISDKICWLKGGEKISVL
ncbi:beta-lactamase superfamily domain-containing protein [Aspergillus pseudoustus]|uniref:Beta-lactamase superfamily domain-containing protein n=1 Tax=Aspergillus pseudoustus TaxID=1810923 RepID=A0ABR4JYY4_9EURO